jgi:hypothetical protein
MYPERFIDEIGEDPADCGGSDQERVAKVPEEKDPDDDAGCEVAEDAIDYLCRHQRKKRRLATGGIRALQVEAG